MSERFDRNALKDWRRTVYRLLRRLTLDGDALAAGVVLAAVCHFGTDLSVLTEITGLSPDCVKRVLHQMRKTGMLRAAVVRVADWGSKKYGDFAFILDAVSAAGTEIRRYPDPAKSETQQRAAKKRARTTIPAKRRRRIVPTGAVFTPKVEAKNDKWYGLTEWERREARRVS